MSGLIWTVFWYLCTIVVSQQCFGCYSSSYGNSQNVLFTYSAGKVHPTWFKTTTRKTVTRWRSWKFILRQSWTEKDVNRSVLHSTLSLNKSGTLAHKAVFAGSINASTDIKRKLPVSELARSYIFYKVGKGINRYWVPILVPLGLCGNIITLVIMANKHNRQISVCIYMSSLAVSDNIMLCLSLDFWLATNGVWTRTVHPWQCKVLTWLFQVFSTYGIILVIAMTLDRLIAVRWPLKAATICTASRAKLTSLSALLLMFIYTLPHLFSAELLDDRTCAGFANQTPLTQVYSWIIFVINALLPFTILLICNLLIISALRRRITNQHFRASRNIYVAVGESRGSGSSTPPTGSSGQYLWSAKDTQLVIMLLCVTFTLLLLTLPLYLRYALFLVIDYRTNPRMYAIYILVYHLSHKLYLTNNAVNALLYCASGSKFRHEVCRILNCGRKLNRERNISVQLEMTRL